MSCLIHHSQIQVLSAANGGRRLSWSDHDKLRIVGTNIRKGNSAIGESGRIINGHPPEARLWVHRRLSEPPRADLGRWRRGDRALLSKQAKVAKPIASLLSSAYWPGFMRFLETGRVCLTTTLAEWSLRSVALGLKHWLFAGSERGGRRAAAMYTLIGTVA